MQKQRQRVSHPGLPQRKTLKQEQIQINKDSIAGLIGLIVTNFPIKWLMR